MVIQDHLIEKEEIINIIKNSIISTYTEPGPRRDKLTFSRTFGGKCSAKIDSKLSNFSSKLTVILSKIRGQQLCI